MSEDLEDYDVREDQRLRQCEKETTIRVDKEEGVVNLHSQIGSHIRKIIKSPNENIEIHSVQTDKDDNIIGIGADIPIDSITISVKKSPKKQGYLSSMLLS